MRNQINMRFQSFARILLLGSNPKLSRLLLIPQPCTWPFLSLLCLSLPTHKLSKTAVKCILGKVQSTTHYCQGNARKLFSCIHSKNPTINKICSGNAHLLASMWKLWIVMNNAVHWWLFVLTIPICALHKGREIFSCWVWPFFTLPLISSHSGPWQEDKICIKDKNNFFNSDNICIIRRS